MITLGLNFDPSVLLDVGLLVHGNSDPQSERFAKANAHEVRGGGSLWTVRQTLRDRMSRSIRALCERRCQVGRARFRFMDRQPEGGLRRSLIPTPSSISFDGQEMTRVRVKGFQIFADRHGKMRCYHRNTRTSVDLEKAPLGSAEFFSECARITELTRMAGPPKPGTLGLLAAEYRASRSFLELAIRTRADYQRCLDYLQPIADTPLVRFDRALVVRIRDKAGS